MGFPADRVSLKSAPAKLGTVKDIATEAEKGLYDAVVLGRRGLSWFDEIFDDSITHRLLWGEHHLPPCGSAATPCDTARTCFCAWTGPTNPSAWPTTWGSSCANEPEHSVTVFHNRAQSLPEGERIEDIMGQAGEILNQNGIEDERIDYLVKSSMDPAELILKQARQGEYAAVAVGRTGGRPTTRDNIFGTTSLTLLRKLEGSALWVSK